MKRILSNTIIVLMAALAMISCKESAVVDPTVTLTEQTIELTQKETYQLTAELSDYSHDYIVWASNNSEVATVSQEGLVTAVAPGTAEITAKCEYGKDRKTCTVTVKPIYVTALNLNKTSVTKKEGETETLTATITPSDATYQTLKWTSSDETVVTVKDGVVSCVGAGTAKVTVSTVDGATVGAALTATCDFDVKSSGNFIKWMDDAAGSKNFITEPVSDPGTSTQGWITYDGTKISWTANTTGAPRVDSLILNTGAKIIISQLEVKDFKGEWSFTTKTFCNDGFVSAGNKVTLPDPIKIGAPKLGETLTDGNGAKHTNNLGVDGLYHYGIIADACVEINYDAKDIQFGLFLDGRKAQLDATPASAEYPYIAFLPEGCRNYVSAGNWSKPWSFVTPDLGEPDYEWMWFTVSEDFKSLVYSAAKAQKYCTSNTWSESNPNGYGPYIIGISILAFNAEDASSANMKNSTVDGSGYNVIYQFNTNGGSVGLKFDRK